LPDIDSTFFHVLCGNLIVSKGSLYVYLFELNLRNLLYVIVLIILAEKVTIVKQFFLKIRFYFDGILKGGASAPPS
ncbi:hypothetical protein, partial [Phascolarctobacterium succinatutens]|uniref:hypothetical protein n=1 Tax=Phascolarctobacterium succinatutens TaxID=626940 RepID=UPI003AF01251